MSAGKGRREDRWKALIGQFDSRIRAYLRRVPCDAGEVEEVIWDVWGLASEHEDELMSDDPWPFVVPLIREVCRQRMGAWRHEQRNEALLRRAVAVDADTTSDDGDGAWSRVEHALGLLTARQRAAVDYRYRWGWPYWAVAAALECSEPTARVHAHRGLARLRILASIPTSVERGR